MSQRAKGFAATENSLNGMKQIELDRGAVNENSVKFDVKYCGICHTDLHFIQKDLGDHTYPLVPGHELIGVVTEVGSNVKDYKIGDVVGVGCMVESCLSCTSCKRNNEQYCSKSATWTYGSKAQHSLFGVNGKQTDGGYTDKFVVDQRFAVKFPFRKEDIVAWARESFNSDDGADDHFNECLAKCAPLLCAGITMYSPIKRFVTEGMKVGIRGLGGLGQMGIKIASKMNAEVYALSHSESKKDEALRLGAKHFVHISASTGLPEIFNTEENKLDVILDTVGTVPTETFPDPFYDMAMDALGTHGKYVLIGLQTKPVAVLGVKFIFADKSVHGSLIGGMKETREMVDFCWKNEIFPDINVIPVSKIQEVLQKLEKGNDSIIRYVIDCSTFE